MILKHGAVESTRDVLCALVPPLSARHNKVGDLQRLVGYELAIGPEVVSASNYLCLAAVYCKTNSESE